MIQNNNYLVYISAFNNTTTFGDNMLAHVELEHRLTNIFGADNIATAYGKYNDSIELSYEISTNAMGLEVLNLIATELHQECILAINMSNQTGAFIDTLGGTMPNFTKAIKTSVLIAERDNYSICHGEKFQWLLD